MPNFDTSSLTQFSKFNHFLWVCWFIGKNLSNFLPPIWKLHNPNCHNVLLWTWPLCSAKSLFNSPTCFLKSPFSIQGILKWCQESRRGPDFDTFLKVFKDAWPQKSYKIPQGSYALKVTSKNLKRGSLFCPKYFPLYFFLHYLCIVR